MMETMNLKDLTKELINAEKFGSMAVRETCQRVMEKQSEETELSDLKEALVNGIDRAFTKEDEEMIATYLQLYCSLCDYAKNIYHGKHIIVSV